MKNGSWNTVLQCWGVIPSWNSSMMTRQFILSHFFHLQNVAETQNEARPPFRTKPIEICRFVFSLGIYISRLISWIHTVHMAIFLGLYPIFRHSHMFVSFQQLCGFNQLISWVHISWSVSEFQSAFSNTKKRVRFEAPGLIPCCELYRLSGLWRALCGTEPEEPTFPIHLPSGYVKIAIENGPFIVDLPIKDGDFQ